MDSITLFSNSAIKLCVGSSHTTQSGKFVSEHELGQRQDQASCYTRHQTDGQTDSPSILSPHFLIFTPLSFCDSTHYPSPPTPPKPSPSPSTTPFLHTQLRPYSPTLIISFDPVPLTTATLHPLSLLTLSSTFSISLNPSPFTTSSIHVLKQPHSLILYSISPNLLIPRCGALQPSSFPFTLRLLPLQLFIPSLVGPRHSSTNSSTNSSRTQLSTVFF